MVCLGHVFFYMARLVSSAVFGLINFMKKDISIIYIVLSQNLVD